MRANQIGLLLVPIARVLIHALREYGLQQTELASGQCAAMRLKLFKIGATVRGRVLRVCVAFRKPTRFASGAGRIVRAALVRFALTFPRHCPRRCTLAFEFGVRPHHAAPVPGSILALLANAATPPNPR